MSHSYTALEGTVYIVLFMMEDFWTSLKQTVLLGPVLGLVYLEGNRYFSPGSTYNLYTILHSLA